jgi:hypothetical protein
VDLLDRVADAVVSAAEAVSGAIWNQIWNQTGWTKAKSGTPAMPKCPVRLVGRQGLDPWTR